MAEHAITDPATEPKFNDQLADFVDREYKRRQNERKPFELQWRLNKEFVDGNQYLKIDNVGQSIKEIPRMYWWEERLTFNQIATIIETRIARLNRQRPIMKVRPSSNDNEDISSAKVSSMLLNSSWFDQEMDDLYPDLIAWLEICGTVLLKPVWNPQKGRVIQQQLVPKEDPNTSAFTPAFTPAEGPAEGPANRPATKELTDDPEQPGDPYDSNTLNEDSEMKGIDDDPFLSNMQFMEIREGDIETAVVPPYQIFPDSNYQDNMERVRSIIHAQAFHVREIEDMWGQLVDPEETAVSDLQEMKSGLGGVGYTTGGYKGGTKKVKDHAVVKEYYERPSKKYPLGRFIVVASGKCLYAGPLPYNVGQNNKPDFPFIPIRAIPNPGCFWGKSLVERCIPIQRRYNALRNRKAEYLNLTAIGQWRVPIGSVDDEQDLNNSPGSIIRYRPGVGTPEPIQFPNLPASFENEIQTLLSEFTAISGVSELSRYSEAPSGVKSGVALSLASEQDDTRLAMTTTRIANGVVQLGKQWLRLYQQFAQEPRLIKNVGRDNQIEVMQWTQSDLKSDDVIVENTSALSETPAQRRQLVFDLLGTGVFNRPEQNPFDDETKAKLMEILEFGNWENNFDDERHLQIGRAKRENANMMKGMPAQVQDFDDHALHIQQHQQWQMTADYEQLLQSPIGAQIDQMFKEHIAVHQQVLQQIQQQQMIQQMQMQQMMNNRSPGGGDPNS